MLLNLILNALAQPNYKDVLGEVMNRTKSQRNTSASLFSTSNYTVRLKLGQRKLFFERIIEQ